MFTWWAMLLMMISRATFSIGMCDCSHRYDVLMELYSATNGQRWKVFTGWGTSNCDWFGVTCSNSAGSPALYDVTGIDLSQNNLQGTLPASLSQLVQLTLLQLHYNSLQGTLPQEWGSLPSIQNIFLYSNRFSGTLPPAWGNLTTMQELYLDGNSLYGSIPASWASLINVQHLYLSHNTLDGTLPAFFANMSQMSKLSLSNNRFSGALPRQWEQLHKLVNLDVSYNKLGGTFAATWGSMISLQSLHISSNCLYGSFPDALMAGLPLSMGGVELCRTRLKSSYFGCIGNTDWPSGCRYASFSSTASQYPTVSATIRVDSVSTQASSSMSTERSASKSRSTPQTDTNSCNSSLSYTLNESLSVSQFVAETPSPASPTFSGTSSQTITGESPSLSLSTILSLTRASPTLTTSHSMSATSASFSPSTTNAVSLTACMVAFSMTPASLAILNASDIQVLACADSSTTACDAHSLVDNTTITLQTITSSNQGTASNTLSLKVVSFPVLSTNSTIQFNYLAVHLCTAQGWHLRPSRNSTNVTILTSQVFLSDINSGGVVSCTAVVAHIEQSLTLVSTVTATNLSLEALCIGGGIPVPVSIVIYWPTPESKDTPSTVSTATEGATSAGTILGTVGGAASAASSTAMLAILTCDDVPPINTVTYFVSVFFELGLATVALGNAGVAMAVLLLQFFAVLVLRWSKKANVSNGAVSSFVDAHLSEFATCRFPSLSIQVMSLLLPGSLLGAVGVTLREPTPSNVALGAIAIICIFTAFAGQLVVQRLIVLPRASFVLYRLPYCAGTDVEKRFLFPAGRWEPSQVSQAFGSLFAPMTPGYSQLLIVEMMLACVLGIASGAFIGGICDSPLLAFVAVLHIAYCTFLVVARPHRLPADRVFAPIIHLLVGVICVLRYDRPRDAVRVAPLQQALSIIQTGSSICTLYYHSFREGSLRVVRDRTRDDFLEEDDGPDLSPTMIPLKELVREQADTVSDIDFADETGFWDNEGNATTTQNNVANTMIQEGPLSTTKSTSFLLPWATE